MIISGQPLSSFFFGLPTNFSNHNNTFGLGVVNEFLENINEVGSMEGVSTNTNNGGLSKASSGGLVNCFVSKST